eukprot:3970572-Lingulodinium_polyedra.AAC.1
MAPDGAGAWLQHMVKALNAMGSGGRDPSLGPPAACQMRAIEHLASACTSVPVPPEEMTPYQAFKDVVGSVSGYSDQLARNYAVLHRGAH